MLLAVTRSPIPWEGERVARRHEAPWHVLAVHDDAQASLETTPTSIRVSHSPLAALGLPHSRLWHVRDVRITKTRAAPSLHELRLEPVLAALRHVASSSVPRR